MFKALLAAGAAVITFRGTPAIARPNHVTVFQVGYSFGPSYSYTDFSALPQPIVTRYHLTEKYRCVDGNGYVYVVSPRTYCVVRVIRVPM